MQCKLRDDRKENILLGLTGLAVLVAATIILSGLMAGLGYIVTQSEILVFSHYAEGPLDYYAKSGFATLFLLALVAVIGFVVLAPLYLVFNGIKKLCSKQGRQELKDFWFKCEE